MKCEYSKNGQPAHHNSVFVSFHNNHKNVAPSLKRQEEPMNTKKVFLLGGKMNVQPADCASRWGVR